MLQSSSDTSPGGSEGQKRVVIDGVVFQFEQDGKKLTRIGGKKLDFTAIDPSELPGAKKDVNNTPTRHSLKYQGENFRRTKRGNLISRSTCEPNLAHPGITDNPRASARRAEQAKRPCRYYTKTGASRPVHQQSLSIRGLPHTLVLTLLTYRSLRARFNMPVPAHSGSFSDLSPVPQRYLPAWRQLSFVPHPLSSQHSIMFPLPGHELLLQGRQVSLPPCACRR